MTRVSMILLIILGALRSLAVIQGTVWEGWSWPGPLEIAIGFIMVLVGAFGLRMRQVHGLVLVLALAALAQLVPSYFLSARIWPDLALLIIACLSFGFGLLGFVLDRFSAAPAEAQTTL